MSEEREQGGKRVLVSSLMQTNSHCLPANMLLDIRRLRNVRGSEITSSIVSSVCESQTVHIRERERGSFLLLFSCSLKDYVGKIKALEDMK